MNELALFLGVGGGILGSRLLGWRTICGVEIDPYCREVILRRQEEGTLEPFPVWDDVETFDGNPWREKVDIVTGGFPCQPFSIMGKHEGQEDERNCWPDTIRIIRQVLPKYCLLENVPNLLANEYFGTILRDLAESGYDVRWDCISASALGAPHPRERLWILGKSKRAGLWRKGESANLLRPRENPWGALGGASMLERITERNALAGKEDFPKPLLFRDDDGMAYLMDRLRAIGNGQVPEVVRYVWESLTVT